MRDERRLLWLLGVSARGGGLALLLVILAAAPAAAKDPHTPSRKCRAVIAQQTAKVVILGLKLLDACHVKRDAGKRVEPCLPLVAADPKGKLGAARAKALAAIDKTCALGDPVRGNYPGGRVATALLPQVETLLAESAATLQGSPALVGDKQAVKCHAAVGKARSTIVRAIVTQAAKCQKALDKRATTFGGIADACVGDAAKAAAKARAKIAKACRRKDGTPISGADVGSCADLPACVVAAATATAQALATGVYAQPSVCGDGHRDPGEICPGLEGTPGEPALDALATLDLELGVPESAIEETPEGARVARSRIEIELAPAATVASANALLDELGASILMAVANAPIVLLQIPDPGSLAALEGVLASARAHPSVATATAGFFAEPDLLPDNFDAANPAVDLTMIDHQLAIRASASWNARGALAPLGARPLVVIGDLFGDGPPDEAVDAAGIVAGDFATGNPHPGGHGYHVLGIVAAAASGPACAAPLTAPLGRGCATGTFPGTIRLRAVDLQAGLTTAAARLRMIQRLLLEGAAVLSTSLNDCGLGTCGSETIAKAEGRKWTLLMRHSGLENRVLHLTSAGNIKPAAPFQTDAQYNSAFTAAALLPGLVDLTGDPLANLTNVLVVENARHTAAEPYVPRCRDRSSKRGGHVSGIGADVWSLRDATGTSHCTAANVCSQDASEPFPTPCTVGNDTPCQAGNETGTSMATPQVAGLAAYLWALAPTLSVTELRSLLLATTVTVGNGGGLSPCDVVAPPPAIDAYAAVLALDGTATPPSPASAPVRHAILDADGDGVFDQHDLRLFLDQYVQGFVDAESHGPPASPTTRDYGRFDLNGDGFTGGPERVPFDLDRIGSEPLGPPTLDRVFQALDEGGGVFFEPTGLTDLEILCYYAASALYQGSPAARAALVDPAWCNPVEVAASFDTDDDSDLQPGESAPLLVTVVYRDASGVPSPLAGVHVAITVDGGAGDGSGTTDTAGEVERLVTPAQGIEEVTITVEVRSAAGGLLLAETSFSAGIDQGEPSDACDDFRPQGVYLDFRNSLTYGNTVALYIPATTPGNSANIYRLESADQLHLRSDLPGAPFSRYFGSWTGNAAGSRSGTRSGITSSGSFAASQTSAMQGQAVALEQPGGAPYDGFLFQGFTFAATAATTVSHANTGTLWAESSSVASNNTCVSFSVVGARASFDLDANFGPGVFVEFEGRPCAEGHEDFYHYYFNEGGEVEDDLPGGGLLEQGSYVLCVGLFSSSYIATNVPDGFPNDPSAKDLALEFDFSVQ